MLVTHDMAEAAYLGRTAIVLLQTGTIVQKGISGRSSRSTNKRVCLRVYVRPTKFGAAMKTPFLYAFPAKRIRVFFVFLCLCVSLTSAHAQDLRVGSKAFTESYVLGEIAKRTLNEAGFMVEHKQGMGKTGIVWGALKTGQITCYPEYTGTISEELLKAKGEMSSGQMQKELQAFGIGMTGELGFNDTYALAMRKEQAARLKIRKH